MRQNGDHHSGSWKKEVTEKNDAEGPDNSPKNNSASPPKVPDDTAGPQPIRSNSLLLGGAKRPLDPHEYQYAKRRLRKAVIEHYRCVDACSFRNLAIAEAVLAQLKHTAYVFFVECIDRDA